MLTIEYLSKFGYVIDWDDTVFIVDYTDGRLPSSYLKDSKLTYFLTSEINKKHYDQSITVYKKPIVTPQELSIDNELYLVEPGDILHFGSFQIRAIGSEKNGLGYIISKEGIDVFHTGSLTSETNIKDPSIAEIEQTNDRFNELIEYVDGKVDLDILIAQVNPLKGEKYDQDARYVVEALKPKKILPMNFGRNVFDIERFSTWVKEVQKIDYMRPKHENKKYRIEGL